MSENGVWKYFHANEVKPEAPMGWIQWKGTDVCVDLDCVCGHSAHLDGEFLYFYQCSNCKRKYGLSGYIRLIEIPDSIDTGELTFHGETEED